MVFKLANPGCGQLSLDQICGRQISGYFGKAFEEAKFVRITNRNSGRKTGVFYCLKNCFLN
jgi:hypothetical protein